LSDLDIYQWNNALEITPYPFIQGKYIGTLKRVSVLIPGERYRPTGSIVIIVSSDLEIYHWNNVLDITPHPFIQGKLSV